MYSVVLSAKSGFLQPNIYWFAFTYTKLFHGLGRVHHGPAVSLNALLLDIGYGFGKPVDRFTKVDNIVVTVKEFSQFTSINFQTRFFCVRQRSIQQVHLARCCKLRKMAG